MARCMVFSSRGSVGRDAGSDGWDLSGEEDGGKRAGEGSG